MATLTAEEVAHLLALALALDLPPNATGTCMSSTKATAALFTPDLNRLFPDGWVRCMVSVVYPGGSLPGHVDRRAQLPRFHVPLTTDPYCWTYHEGAWHQPPVGVFYVMDPTQFHGAINWGTTPRYHLIIDAPSPPRSSES